MSHALIIYYFAAACRRYAPPCADYLPDAAALFILLFFREAHECLAARSCGAFLRCFFSAMRDDDAAATRALPAVFDATARHSVRCRHAGAAFAAPLRFIIDYTFSRAAIHAFADAAARHTPKRCLMQMVLHCS